MFTFERNDLMAGLNYIAGAIPSTNGQIINNVHLYSRSGEAFVEATNLEICIKTNVKTTVPVAEDVDWLISAKTFVNLIKDCDTDKSIDITKMATDSRVRIKSGKSNFTLPLDNFSGYPSFVEKAISEPITIPSAQFVDMVNTSYFAALDSKQDSNRVQFTGMLLNVVKDKIEIAVTDSRRLVSNAIGCDTKGVETDMVVAIKTMREICNLIAKTKSETVSLVTTEGGGLLFVIGSLVLISRLLNGKFPQYQPLIPKETAINFNINANVLLRSLKQINNVIGIKNVISIKISENNLHLYNWGNESNVGNIDLDIIYTGEEVEVLVNPDYLLDMLSEIGTSDITFSMKDKDSVVKINVGDRPNYDYIVMPIKM